MEAANRFEDFLTNEEEEKKPFVIETKEQAIWAMRRIATLEKDFREEEEAAKKEIELIHAWVEKQKERYEKDTEYLRYQLEQYHRKQLENNPQAKTIRLPHGTMKIRAQQPHWEWDEDKLLPWLRANKPEMVREKVTYNIDKKAVKDKVSVNEGTAVDQETGEVIPGIAVQERPEKFILEVE